MALHNMDTAPNLTLSDTVLRLLGNNGSAITESNQTKLVNVVTAADTT